MTLKFRMWQGFRYLCAVSIILIGLLSIIATGGGGGGGSSSDGPDDSTGAFESTTSKEGFYGDSGRYTIEYYDNAKPAQRQLRENAVPSVIEKPKENLYVLDIQRWPVDWKIGSLITIKLKDGMIVYKRLMLMLELSDERFAVIAEDGSLLEAVDKLTLTSDRNDEKLKSSNRALKARSIREYYETGKVSWDIIDSEYINLFNEKETIKKNKDISKEIEIYAGLKDAKLSLEGKWHADLTIDGAQNLDEVDNFFGDLVNAIRNIIALHEFLDVVYDENDEIIITEVSLEKAKELSNSIERNDEVKKKIADLQRILVDKERLKYGDIGFDGEIVGSVTMMLGVSGAYADKKEKPFWALSVPVLTYPIPIFFESKPKGIANFKASAEANIAAGVEVEIPAKSRIFVVDGELYEMERSEFNPVFEFTDDKPLTGAKGEISPSLGLQLECGLSAAKILSTNIAPNLSCVFDVKVLGDVNNPCFYLDWDIYGKFTTKAQGSLSLVLKKYTVGYPLIEPITFFKEGPPQGHYELCWNDDGASDGMPISDAGPDQRVFSGDTVFLDARNTDAPFGIEEIKWEQIDGDYQVDLNTNNPYEPSFVAPNIESGQATLVFKLTVEDYYDNQDTDTCMVVVQSASVSQYTVTATAGPGGSVSPSSRIVDSGSTASFTVNANSGYAPNETVGGTCPAGSWSGSTYTTEDISGDCSVSFSFNEEHDDTGESVAEDFVGTWSGSVAYSSDMEDQIIPITIDITLDGGQLIGKFYDEGYEDEPLRMIGSVSGERWEFEMHVHESEADEPDCRDWDVSGLAELRNGGSKMEISASGTFCGPGGGQPGSFDGTLEKTGDDGNDGSNGSPIAYAGPDQTVSEGDTVYLDGSNSAHPDGQIDNMGWDQTEGTPEVD